MTDEVLDEVNLSTKPLIFKGKNVFTSPGVAAGYVILIFSTIAVLTTLISFFDGSTAVIKLIIMLFFFGMGYCMAFAKEAFIVDPVRKVYKKSTFYLGWSSTDWETLPKIESVTAMPKDYRYSVQNSITPSMTITESRYKVMLFVKDAERGIIVSYYWKKEAIRVGEELAAALKVNFELL